ncbi:MAG: hypothetical protein AAB654_20810 [Acidobacteriota bacterium]
MPREHEFGARKLRSARLPVEPKRLDLQLVAEAGALERPPVDVGFVQPQQYMSHSGRPLAGVKMPNPHLSPALPSHALIIAGRTRI